MAGKLVDILNIGANTHERLIGTDCSPLGPYEIGLTGLSDARSGFHFARYDPNFVQILACTGGEGEVRIDNEWVRCGPGLAYITPSHSTHEYRALPDQLWHLAWVQYWPSTISLDQPPSLKSVDPQPLESAILGLYRESHAAASTSVMASWAHLIDTAARRILGDTVHDSRLSTMWEAVGAELPRPWTLKEMAHRAHMSPEHLRRLCNARFGRSPLRQLAYMRLRRGGELLRSTQVKIDVIARQVGYDSAFAFSAAFKREFGVPPSSYRR